MKPFEIISSSEQIQLRVSGDISIQNARESLAVFREFQSKGNRLLLDLEGVAGADVSFLQLICSLHRTCLKAGQNLTLMGNMPEAFKTILKLSGYRRPKACTFGGGNPCLWSWREEI
ncbi:MAG: STAS domain-containing protein [Deltaproteobacteria bacterium]|nr:STAS domain-containing protein [Deltaproteobacteria bacterium]